MARKTFKPEIGEELDIAFTAIMEISKGKKDVTVNAVLQKFVDEETEKLTATALSEYVGKKTIGEQERQWAFVLLGAKVREGKI